MVRGELLIFGYRELLIDPDRVADAAGILLKLGIVGEISPDGRILIPLRRYSDFIAALGDGAQVSVGKVGGIPGVLVGIRHRGVTMCTLILLLALYFVFGNVIWDIRITGNSTLSEDKILSELSEVGVKVGASWSELDRNEAETHLLSRSQTLSWVSINRSGGVAYVEVAELVEGEDDTETEEIGIGNIVSDRDCVIEEITVNRGAAAVKVGDVVKEGDILIAGVVQSENGTEYCHASGSVLGISDGEICVFRSYTDTEEVLTYETVRPVGIKFFGFSINILKRYGNLSDPCVIIEEKPLIIFGKAVPLSLLCLRERRYDERQIRYDTDTLVEIVSEDYSRALVNFLVDCDMISVKTNANFRDDGYEMTGRVIYSTDVGIFAPIELKEE